MKLLDEKGRLFGALNLLDLLALLALAAALVFGGFRLLTGPNSPLAPPKTPLTFTVRVVGVDQEIYNAITRFVDKETGKKDQLMAFGELADAYVVDLYAAPRVSYATDADGVVRVTEEVGDGARLDVYFVIEANFANAITRELGNQEVRTGKNHIVRTTHFELLGTVISMER